MKITKEVQNRLLEVVNGSKLNKSQFANSMRVLPSFISDILSGKISTLSGPIVSLLEVKYAVNPVWLETGIGSKRIKTLTTSNEEEIEIIGQLHALNDDSRSLLRTIVKTLVAAQDEIEKTKKTKEKKLSASK